MRGDATGIMSSDCPIACLDIDVLSLLSEATHSGPWERSQSAALHLPLTLSHVCRRWRAQALEQPYLWSRFVWRPESNCDAALAILERSRAALLTVDISLLTNDISDAQRQAGKTVFRALIPHFWRTSHLTLVAPCETLDGDLLTSILSSDMPCAMPQLRHLDVQIWVTMIQGRRLLNILCPPLAHVALYNILPQSWEALLGQRTTVIHLSKCPILISELRHVLRLAPNLISLDLKFCEILELENEPLVASQDIDSAGALCTQLNRLYFHPPTLASMVLMRTLPIRVGRIRTVILQALFTEIPFELSYEYMRVGDLVDIVDMTVCKETYAFNTAGGEERLLTADAPSVAVLHDLFAHTPALSTITALTVDFQVWPALFGVMAAARAPDVVCLPRLETLRVLLTEDESGENANAGGDDGLDTAVRAPALTRIELAQQGFGPPTKPLVQRLVRALKGLQAPGALLTLDSEHTLEGNARLVHFLELVREEMSGGSSSGLIAVPPQP